MTRQKLVFAAALFTALSAPAFAGDFMCQGVTSQSVVCADVIQYGVTNKFAKKYPQSKYRIFVVSGYSKYENGYSGSAAVWLGSTSSQAPRGDSYAMFHFSAAKGTEKDALQNEKDALLSATQELMRKLDVGAPPAQVQQAAVRQCRTVQETEQTLQSDYVCDYNNLGPTNCRTENKSVPRTVDKQVCT